jgi:hypothetical protein
VLKLIGAAYPAQRQRMSDDDVRAMAAIYTASTPYGIDVSATEPGVAQIGMAA